jgi:hypothetical protein
MQNGKCKMQNAKGQNAKGQRQYANAAALE